MSLPPLTGGCHCGRIRYEISLNEPLCPPDVGATDDMPVSEHPNGVKTPIQCTVCHCGDCRKTTGAYSLPYVSVAAPQFKFVGPHKPRPYRSSDIAERQFCDQCGAGITWMDTTTNNPRVSVRVGTLDEPDRVAPVAHIWTASACRAVRGWIDHADAGMKVLDRE